MKLTDEQFARIPELEAMRVHYLPGHIRTNRVSTFLLVTPIVASVMATLFLDLRHPGEVIGASVALGFGLLVLYLTKFAKDDSHLFIRQYKEDLIKPYLKEEYGAKNDLDYAAARTLYESSIYAPDVEEMRFLLGESFSIKAEGLDVAFYEIDVSYRSGDERRDHYAGAFVSVELPTRFTGITTLSNVPGDFGNSAIEMDNIRFHGRYDVMSSNETEARYLLTPKVMENLENLNSGIYDSIKVEFFDNKMFLFLKSKRDLMEPTDMHQPVTSESVRETLKKVRSEVQTVLETVRNLELEALPEVKKRNDFQEKRKEKELLSEVLPIEKVIREEEKEKPHAQSLPDASHLAAKEEEKRALERQSDFTFWWIFYRGGLFSFLIFGFILFLMYAGDPRSSSRIFNDTVVRFISTPDTIETPGELSRVSQGDLIEIEPKGYCYDFDLSVQSGYSGACRGVRFLDGNFSKEDARKLMGRTGTLKMSIRDFIKDADASWVKAETYTQSKSRNIYGEYRKTWDRDFIHFDTVVLKARELCRKYGLDSGMVARDLLALYAQAEPQKASRLKRGGIERLAKSGIKRIKSIDPGYREVFKRKMDRFAQSLILSVIDANMDFPGYALRVDERDPDGFYIPEIVTPVSFKGDVIRINRIEHFGPQTVLYAGYAYGPMDGKSLATVVIFGLLLSNLIYSMIWSAQMNRRREGR